MEHKKEEVKEVKKELEVCEMGCKKNMSCFRGHCACMRRLAKALAFIMLVIITVSVVKIACSMHRMHDNHERGQGQQTGMMYQMYR